MHKYSKFIMMIIAVLLVLCISLAASSEDVYAQDPSYPTPTMIRFGYNGDSIAFSENLQYYKNGDERRGRFTGTSADYNAYYNKNVGILALYNYNGPTINVLDGDGESLAILIAGNCSVNGSKYGIIAPNIKLEIRGNGSLTVNVNNTDPDMWPVAGIASYSWNDESVPNDEGDINGTITISGNIAVRVNVSSAGNGNGVVSYGNVVLKDYVALTVDTRICGSIVSSSDVPNNKLYRASSLFIGKGSLVAETSKIADFRLYDTAETSDLAFTYCQADNDNNHLYPVELSSQKCPQLAFSVEKPNSTKPGVCNRSEAYLTNQTHAPGYTYSATENYPYCYNVITLTKSGTVFDSAPLTGANFPDPFFRDYIESCLDTNNDRYIDASEANDLSLLDINDVENGESVRTLKGLEYINVEELEWQDGSLHYREDLTNCKTLKYIDVSGNSDLTKLYAHELPNLEQLYCSNCSLETCWTKDCPSLIYLDCSYNQIEQIDLNASTGLLEILCSNNKLKVIGLRKCTLVERIDASNNPVELMDYHIATCKKLKALYCNNCINMTRLNVTNHPDLEILQCTNCGALEGIDLSKNTKLTRLDISECTGIGTLDLTNCTNLQRCICWGCGLTDLTLGAKHQLDHLRCYGNQLQSIDIGLCDSLVYAYLNGTENDYGYYVSYTAVGSRFRLDIDKDVEIIRSVALRSAYLSLEGKISINFKVQAPRMDYVAKLYYEKAGFEQVAEVPLNSDHFVSDPANYDYYLVTYSEVPAKEMTQQLRIKVFDANGNQVPMKISSGYIDQYDYSVAKWCTNKINAANPVERDVMIAKALLNYGHYSQLALKYNDGRENRPDNMPAAWLESEMGSVTANSAYDRITDGGKALGAKSFILVLESDTLIKLLLERQVSVSIDGTPVTLAPEKDANGNAVFAAYSSGVAAKRLHERKALTLAEGDNSATLYYGVLSWANSKLANGNEDDQNLARAMYLYNAAARRYFHYDEAGL